MASLPTPWTTIVRTMPIARPRVRRYGRIERLARQLLGQRCQECGSAPAQVELHWVIVSQTCWGCAIITGRMVELLHGGER